MNGRTPVKAPASQREHELALVATARREMLLRSHRHRLRREDLEDCYSQAVLELIAAARAGRRYESRDHMANAIELRFLSRVRDRRRAVTGRSPSSAAQETAIPLIGAEGRAVDVADVRAAPDELLIARERLAGVVRNAPRLSFDQRLVIASQVALQMGCAEFCRDTGWSPEKYRKVAQRGRARLRLLDQDRA